MTPTDGKVFDEIKVKIAFAVVQKPGYTNNQYIAIAHRRNDTTNKMKAIANCFAKTCDDSQNAIDSSFQREKFDAIFFERIIDSN